MSTKRKTKRKQSRDVNWQMVNRRQKNRAPTKASPTISQERMIVSLSLALGIEAKIPATEAEAKFLVDELIERERRQKRA